MAEDSPRGRSQHTVPITSTGYERHLAKGEIKENGLLGPDYRDKRALKGEEDLITWMPIAANNDIVDLSDEDTIRRKKRMNLPPTDTKLLTRDPPRGEKTTHKDLEQEDSYPETEYAEVDTPPSKRKGYDRNAESLVAMDSPNDLPVMLINKTYGKAVPDPPARRVQQLQSFHLNEDTEYATPRETANSPAFDGSIRNSTTSGEQVVTKPSKSDDKGSYTNKAFVKNEPQRKPPRRPGSRKPKPGNDGRAPVSVGDEKPQLTASSECQTSSAPDDPESQSFHSSDGRPSETGSLYSAENETPQLPPRRQWMSTPTIEKKANNAVIETEETEYSVPNSNRSSYVLRPLPEAKDNDHTEVTSDALNQIQQESNGGAISSAQSGNKPSLPPKPAPKDQLLNAGVIEDPPYATIDKLKKTPTSPKAPDDHHDDADQSGEGEGSSTNDSSSHVTGSASIALQAPARRKRPRKRSKQPRAPEEDVYDGTKDYEDLEVDSGFYTDTSKTKIKRSSRLPVMKPDPNDTRYWITVSNDY
ncbi:hypothetical protein EGW08_014512 [Elysia chlorotica]|uniref:Uncharacterized protein n=1 Tax=Elysia chlorotica TaxID=188477 RepID=A0A433T8A5_ELYCH|nr:hypothetical protein EGW08_014512 [Elysia chlorotica]